MGYPGWLLPPLVVGIFHYDSDTSGKTADAYRLETATMLSCFLALILLVLPSLALAQEAGGEVGGSAADAGKTLLQYGAIGAMLLLSLVAMYFLARYIAKLYDRILEEKEKQNQDNIKALERELKATTNLEGTAAAMRETTAAMKTIVERFLSEREREREWQLRERELAAREGDRR